MSQFLAPLPGWAGRNLFKVALLGLLSAMYGNGSRSTPIVEVAALPLTPGLVAPLP